MISRRLKAAGLSRAISESKHSTDCKMAHGMYRERYNWNFCPRCGLKLEIFKTCEHCGKHFISEKAYYFHLQGIERKCPKCGSKNRIRIIGHNKKSDTATCDGCGYESFTVPKKGL